MGVHLLRAGCVAMTARSPRVVAALISNESAEPLQTDSDPEKRRRNSLKGCVNNNLQVWMT